MKKIIFILLAPIISFAQFPKEVHNKYEPRIVQDMIYEMVNDSVMQKTITFENFRYTYQIKTWQKPNTDSIFARWELTKKEKLFYRPYTAIALTAFGVTMSTMLSFSSIDVPKDKKLHALAGFYIGMGTTALVYKFTHKKWLSILIGELVGIGVGAFKEYVWDKNMGGVTSDKDFFATGGGTTTNAAAMCFILR